MKCLNKQNEILLFLVANGDSTLCFFYMGVNSIRADKLSPLVPRRLNKKEVNIFGQFLCLWQQFSIFNSWVFYDISFRDQGKKGRNCSNFFCRLSGTKLNFKLIKSD